MMEDVNSACRSKYFPRVKKMFLNRKRPRAENDSSSVNLELSKEDKEKVEKIVYFLEEHENLCSWIKDDCQRMVKILTTSLKQIHISRSIRTKEFSVDKQQKFADIYGIAIFHEYLLRRCKVPLSKEESLMIIGFYTRKDLSPAYLWLLDLLTEINYQHTELNLQVLLSEDCFLCLESNRQIDIGPIFYQLFDASVFQSKERHKRNVNDYLYGCMINYQNLTVFSQILDFLRELSHLKRDHLASVVGYPISSIN
jgi:hypothetical protein